MKEFREVKIGERFRYNGKLWIRTQGRFARPIGVIGWQWPFKLNTAVESVS